MKLPSHLLRERDRLTYLMRKDGYMGLSSDEQREADELVRERIAEVRAGQEHEGKRSSEIQKELA